MCREYFYRQGCPLRVLTLCGLETSLDQEDLLLVELRAFVVPVITEPLEPVEAASNIDIVYTADGLQFWTRKPLS